MSLEGKWREQWKCRKQKRNGAANPAGLAGWLASLDGEFVIFHERVPKPQSPQWR